jgi:serine/threonine-protein kinase SRPK3
VLKIYIRTPDGKINREKVAYEHLAGMTTAHSGCLHIRPAIDMFDLTGKIGDSHVCLVHPPLQTTLFDFQKRAGRRRPFPEQIAKPVMEMLLNALDFLHTEANITHCGEFLPNIFIQMAI